MADDAKQAWSEVGEKFATWGKQVAARYHETAGPERTPEEEEKEFKRQAKEVIDELGRGVNAVADTIRDEAARKEFADALRAMGDAIGATVNEVGEGLRSRRGTSDTEEPPPPPPTA